MMRRPAEFPDLGKTYNIEWTQFQGNRADDAGAGCGRARLRDPGTVVAGERRGRVAI